MTVALHLGDAPAGAAPSDPFGFGGPGERCATPASVPAVCRRGQAGRGRLMSDALDVERRPDRPDTATSHVVAADGTAAAATDAELVASMLRARLEEIDAEGGR